MFSQLPPPPPLLTVVLSPSDVLLPDHRSSFFAAPPPPSSLSVSSSRMVVVIIIASVVIVAASAYVFARLLSSRFRTAAAVDDAVLERDETPGYDSDQRYRLAADSLLDSMPIFTFRSVAGSSLTGGDCAVCLSKFEPHEELRLLPLCCHAFHAACIDAWIVSNQTCPICRSTVLPTDADVRRKIMSSEDRGANVSINNSFRNGNGDSFRVEIGSVSRRRGAEEVVDGQQRSYSMGSYEYIVEDGSVVSIRSFAGSQRRGASDCTSGNEIPIAVNDHAEISATDVGGGGSGRNWLREYVDRLAAVYVSSRAMSFRSSGRFFSGSSRRSDTVVPVEELEVYRAGEEVSELFRWLSEV